MTALFLNRKKANKTDAGNGSKAIGRVSNVLRSPSPDPKPQNSPPMIRFDDYPYAQFREAFGTLLGRVGLVLLAALGGSMLGGLTATRSIEGLWLGVIGLPGLSLASIFYGVGLFVLPALLIYAIASIRCEWPLRLTLLCALLMWWNIHKTIRLAAYESPMAKQQQKFQADFENVMKKEPRKADEKNRK